MTSWEKYFQFKWQINEKFPQYAKTFYKKKKKCLKAVNFKKWDKDVGWHVADKEIQMDK